MDEEHGRLEGGDDCVAPGSMPRVTTIPSTGE